MSKRYQAGILTASYNGLKVPNAPTIGTATAGAGSASVTFTAPSDVGGGAITSYTVISSPGSITGTGSSSPVTVSGLTNGTAYTFTVVATNAYGTGPASAASNSVTPSVNYIEEVFSTYLYTGTGSNGLQIQNGIDLAGKGGLVFGKARSGTNAGTTDWGWVDTTRGGSSVLYSNTTDAAQSTALVSSFNADGFTLNGAWPLNYYGSPYTYASWTFRKQAKFFDIVTYTGNGTGARQISHNLGSEPGCIIVKRTDGVTQWPVYHRSVGAGNYKNGLLNMQDAFDTLTKISAPTSTYFTVSADGDVNASGGTYVAYLFAHNAGGFGLSGSDNVISCGSFTTDGSGNATIDLGYEPQWLLTKSSSSVNDWTITDTMRGWVANGGYADLNPNLSAAEDNYLVETFAPLTATGFKAQFTSGNASKTYIYIAIRRGPMKVPTSGTSVYAPVYASSASSPYTVTTNFPVDLAINRGVDQDYQSTVVDRLRGSTTTSSAYLLTDSTAAEANTTGSRGLGFQNNTAIIDNSFWSGYGLSVIYWNFRRAPSFFDEVCYTGTGSPQDITHNLGVAPELMIVKRRSAAGGSWATWVTTLTANQSLALNTTDDKNAVSSTGFWNSTFPTSSAFSVGTNVNTNSNTVTYVAYLFATCAGVSKVGSYTGTGATQTINCGFTGGARWVLIKRTDSTGDWYVWDTARGMVAGTDLSLKLNSSAGQSNANWVYTESTGFQIVTSNAGVNASGGTYIYLAIA